MGKLGCGPLCNMIWELSLWHWKNFELLILMRALGMQTILFAETPSKITFCSPQHDLSQSKCACRNWGPVYRRLLSNSESCVYRLEVLSGGAFWLSWALPVLPRFFPILYHLSHFKCMSYTAWDMVWVSYLHCLFMVENPLKNLRVILLKEELACSDWRGLAWSPKLSWAGPKKAGPCR